MSSARQYLFDPDSPVSPRSRPLPRDLHNIPYPNGAAKPAAMSSTTVGDAAFEVFDWYPAHQSCLKFFLNHAQHEHHVQAIAAFVNICLPFQWSRDPVYQYPSPSNAAAAGNTSTPPATPSAPGRFVSLVPFIKRLIVTGYDQDAVLHGFFGDDWRKGVGPLHETERRNYMFAAKSVGWARVKQHYDVSPGESVPFVKPLQNVELGEIEAAERAWSVWLAFEDWMIGERAPDVILDTGGGAGLN